MNNKIVISEAHEVQVTPQEFLKRIGMPRPPLHKLFDVVEYSGEYKSNRFAAIDGVEHRSGGWLYHGMTLVMNGTQRVQFSEGSILRVIAVEPTQTEGE